MQRVPREVLADFIKDGGIVLMCGPCMSEFGLKLDDLVPGVQMGRPGYTQGFIFAENATHPDVVALAFADLAQDFRRVLAEQR